MTPAEIALVQSSFSAASGKGPELIALFYEKLFQHYPETRRLFPHDLTDQKQKLLQTLAYAVNSIAHPAALAPILRDLGQSHRSAHVEPAHYAMVGAALIGALRDTLGPGFTPEVERAWIACFLLVSRTMDPRTAEVALSS